MDDKPTQSYHTCLKITKNGGLSFPKASASFGWNLTDRSASLSKPKKQTTQRNKCETKKKLLICLFHDKKEIKQKINMWDILELR